MGLYIILYYVLHEAEGVFVVWPFMQFWAGRCYSVPSGSNGFSYLGSIPLSPLKATSGVWNMVAMARNA